MTSAFHTQPIPPSGSSHAVFLNLTPSIAADAAPPSRNSAAVPSRSPPWLAGRGTSISQLVTARDDVLRVYDLRRSPASPTDPKRETAKLYLLREHRLFGSVTGLQSVSTSASETDGRDRLLVSFKDAKLALLEWSEPVGDLETVSIHTYERATQLSVGLPAAFNQILSVDPASRCAALLLPQDSLAILPFYQHMSELEFYDVDGAGAQNHLNELDSLPYSPSFILPFEEVDPKIKNARDFCFLPGFQKPTVAVLFEQPSTWTGRLKAAKDTYSVYLFTLDLTASMAGQLGGGVEGLQSVHPVLTTSTGLPHDCLYLVPCPSSLGGVMVVTTSSLVHVDQSGRVIITAVSDWFSVISGATAAESTCKVDDLYDLHGSQLVFVGTTEGILTLRDGSFCRFSCLMDGRSVGGIRLERITAPIKTAEGASIPVGAAAPSTSLLVPGGQPFLFNASMVGDSTLFRYARVKELIDRDDEAPAVHQKTEDGGDQDMDLDLDDDLYGDSTRDGTQAESLTKSGYKDVLHLTEADRIVAHGPILDFSKRSIEQNSGEHSKARKQIVACTGLGAGAGLTYFEADAAPRKKRRLDTRSTDRIWRVTIGTAEESEHRIGLLCSAEHDDISEVLYIDSDGSSVEVQELRGRTLAAAPLPGPEVRWTRVSTSGLHVMGEDGIAVQSVAIDQSEVITGNVEDGQYAILQLSDGSFSIHEFDETSSQYTEVALPSALSSKQGACVNVFRDVHHCFSRLDQCAPAADSAAAKTSSSTVQASSQTIKKAAALEDGDDEIDYGDEDVVETEEKAACSAEVSQIPDGTDAVARGQGSGAPAYLFVVDSEAICEIYSLPELQLCWASQSLASLPDRLDLEPERTYFLPAEHMVQIVEAQLCHIGDALHVVAVTDNNLLLAYEANPWPFKDEHRTTVTDARSTSWLSLGFNKVLARVLNASSASARDAPGHPNGTGLTNDKSLCLRPFGRGSNSQNAIAVLGGGSATASSILFGTPKAGIRLVDCDPATNLDDICWLGPADDDVATCSQGSVYLCSFDRDKVYEGEWSFQTFQTGRSYTKVVSHDATRCVIAASANEQQFVLYDDENEPVADPANDKSPTYSLRGALELFADEDRQEPIHGYEFEANETVCSLEVVTLDAPSVPSGRKDFIAAGTVVFHGEDRAAKGSTYLFDVIEVVTSSSDPGNRYRLKLLCKDDSKAPVTAIADINGFLISTSGQKLYVRAFEKEEWLVSVAFLDLAFYVTSIRVVKNFLLLSDIKKSIWFIGFQEDPYRFVILGKDHADQYATTGDFLVNADRVSLVSTSAAGGGILGGREGVFRMFEYAPNVPSTLGGQRLLLKSEYQSAASEAVKSYVVRGKWLSRHERRGTETTRSKILYAMSNGSIETLAAVDEQVIKRLQLLQGQLVRSVRHFAALNPRGFRAVRNDSVSRPLVKGISDGRLVSVFASLSRPKMLDAVSTLSGLFDGLDEQGQDGEAAPLDKDPKPEDPAAESEDDSEAERRRMQREEQRRRRREAKRADLILADLVRLRAGFEEM